MQVEEALLTIFQLDFKVAMRFIVTMLKIIRYLLHVWLKILVVQGEIVGLLNFEFKVLIKKPN